MPRKPGKQDVFGLCPQCAPAAKNKKKKEKHVCNKYICCLCICERCGRPYDRHAGSG